MSDLSQPEIELLSHETFLEFVKVFFSSQEDFGWMSQSFVQSFVLCSCGEEEEEEEEANVELLQTEDKGPDSYLARAITHLESNFVMEEEDANTASAGEMTLLI